MGKLNYTGDKIPRNIYIIWYKSGVEMNVNICIYIVVVVSVVVVVVVVIVVT